MGVYDELANLDNKPNFEKVKEKPIAHKSKAFQKKIKTLEMPF